MDSSPSQPLYHIIRGETIESTHYGSIAVVSSQGDLIARAGNPHLITYLRSTAKPFQALPFLEKGGAEKYKLTRKEIALMCASHSGTDQHIKILHSLQKKIGISEKQLLCGVHPPFHKPSAQLLVDRGENPSPNHHNCSGKHTGMIAHAMLIDAPRHSYPDPEHPVQKEILRAIQELCDIPEDRIQIGVDGCSVPCFAFPLFHTALGWAKLMGPEGVPPALAGACRKITASMTSHPLMVAGPGRLDTQLMQTSRIQLTSKAGAESYQGIGIPPDTLHPGSPALGIAIKISDGDARKRALGAVVLETLKQLQILKKDELESLAAFGPRNQIHNHRKKVVGYGQPCFDLQGS